MARRDFFAGVNIGRNDYAAERRAQFHVGERELCRLQRGLRHRYARFRGGDARFPTLFVERVSARFQLFDGELGVFHLLLRERDVVIVMVQVLERRERDFKVRLRLRDFRLVGEIQQRL